MGPIQLPVNKPFDIRGVRHKSFQLVQGQRAEISITLDVDVLPVIGRPLEDRERGNITWTRILMLNSGEPYASHTGLAAAVLVESASSGPEPVVMMMGHS